MPCRKQFSESFLQGLENFQTLSRALEKLGVNQAADCPAFNRIPVALRRFRS